EGFSAASDLACQPRRVLPGEDAVAFPGHNQDRRADARAAVGHGELRGPLPGLVSRLRLGPDGEGGAAQIGQPIPDLTEAIDGAERYGRPPSPVAAGDAGGVVAAEAHAPDTDPGLVDAGQAGDRVNDGSAWYLPVRPDRQVVLGLALPRPVDRYGG